MPEPEGLQAILQDVEQVFPIGGDSGEEGRDRYLEIFDDMLSTGKVFLCGSRE